MTSSLNEKLPDTVLPSKHVTNIVSGPEKVSLSKIIRRITTLLVGNDKVAQPTHVEPSTNLKFEREMGIHSSDFKSQIPVVVPCFNNPTYTARMLKQLSGLGFQNVMLFDNASTSPEMLTWLTHVENLVKIVRLCKNEGPRYPALDPLSLAFLPRRFCVTDPDLDFNDRLPTDFLTEMAQLAETFKVGKVGFALDISDRKKMKTESFRIGSKLWKIWEWESQFWEKKIGQTSYGDDVFDADVDTTFALYDKKYYSPEKFMGALRVAGCFTARHLPWYRSVGMPKSEIELYRNTQKFSFYLGNENPPK